MYRVRPGRLLACALAAAAFLAALGGGVALAAEGEDLDPMVFEDVFMRLQNTPVYKDACTKTCHGNIAKTNNYSSEIIFQHGYHQLVACSSCHPRFPHRADTTIERPSMQGCFDCHGLRHGPMGILASDDCNDCHMTPKERLRPAFHTFDWSGKPHVAPAEKEFNTRCAMCHDKASCDDCHVKEGVRWAPPVESGWSYDSGDGCQSCHANAGLTKQQSGGSKSFEVLGIDESVHADVTCGQCHTDYRYDDAPSQTQVWSVNAGLSCINCHKDNKDKAKSDPVHLYEGSVHAEAIKKGDYDSATCGSCHGGHFIYALDTDAAKQRMHLSAYRVCARCHDEEYGTYDDYYHGRAYKNNASDAPSCWDCHKAHDVLPSSDPSSSVNPANVGETCGQPGCHKGSNEEFGAEAAALIHEKSNVTEENPILSFINSLRGQ